MNYKTGDHVVFRLATAMLGEKFGARQRAKFGPFDCFLGKVVGSAGDRRIYSIESRGKVWSIPANDVFGTVLKNAKAGQR